MADLSLMSDECMDDSDEGVFEQPDTCSAGTVDLDSIPALVRVQNYAKSANIYDRQMVLRVILELFKTGPALDGLLEDLPEIMGVVATMAEEDEVVVVRTDLLEQIPTVAVRIAQCSQEYPQLKTVTTKHLVPIVVKNLDKSDSQVRNAAHSALLSLLEQKLLTREEAEDTVCPTVIAMTKVDSMIDLNTSAITLMSRLAPLLGTEITERIFLQRFAELCSNKVFYVRKVCASHYGDFCTVIGREAFEQILLPSYIELCGDEIWGVRKECAEVVMSVSCACSPNVRRATLAPAFLKLLQDETRWVRMAAFHSLGPFISTFADPTVTSLTYNSMGELVVVSADGNEFKLISSASMDNIPRSSSNDFHMLYQSSDNLGSNGLRSFIDPYNYDDDTNKEVDIEVNPLCNIIDEEPENGEVTVDIDLPNLEDPVVNEQDKENVLIEKSFDIVSKAMFGEVIQSAEDAEENIQLNGDTYEEPEENLKEIVETVKNAVLSYRTEQESAQCSVNVIAVREETCDKLNSNLNIQNNCASKGSGKEVVENGIEEDPNMFNSYNYWRINPELPLDPSVIDAGRSPTKNVKMLEEHKLVRHLDELYSKLSLDDTMEESSSLNHTFKRNCTEAEQSLENSDAGEGPEHVPKFLIEHYVSMTDPNLAQTTDTDIAYHCAYSLPAVALTLGSHNWHLLKKTVESLAAHMQYKVRRTVACSLHELALILGPDIATTSLTPLFDGFIKDLDEVRIGVLNNLAHFLKLITPEERSAYLPRLADFLRTDSECNWRFREELAKQLMLSVSLFKPCDAIKHLGGIAHKLMCDKVAAVRQVALDLTTQLVKHVSPEKRFTSNLLVKLAQAFAHSKKWKRRQTFALLCSELLTAHAICYEQFGSDVMPHLLDLSWDPVANVRLIVARTIAKSIIVIDYFREPNSSFIDSLETVLRRLQTDKDRDVRQNAVLNEYTNPLI